MKALIDADILLYEIGYSSQQEEVVAGVGRTVEPRDWDFCKDLFDKRIELINDEVGAKEEPLLFLTNTRYINKALNRERKWKNQPYVDFVPNFREKVSVTKEYKGTRKEEKPFHYKNLINYIRSSFPHMINEEGLEADDEMCIYQTLANREGVKTILCSRDKDIRQAKGWHYSWECGKQPSIGPMLVEGLGELTNKNEGKLHPKTGKPLPLKVFGTGDRFFYYQLLTGDSVDNIIGVMGRGPTFSYNLLKDAKTERECYELVAEVYVKTWGDEWETKMQEMIDLLWIIKDRNESGVVKWQKPLRQL